MSIFSQKVSYHRIATFVQQVVQVSHSYVFPPCNESQGGVKWVQSTVVKEADLWWGEAQSLCNLLPLFSAYDTQKNQTLIFVNKQVDK